MPDERTMVAEVAAKMAKQPPREDEAGFKWWKHGNQKAGAGHATANPPPKGYRVSRPDPLGIVKAHKGKKK